MLSMKFLYKFLLPEINFTFFLRGWGGGGGAGDGSGEGEYK